MNRSPLKVIYIFQWKLKSTMIQLRLQMIKLEPVTDRLWLSDYTLIMAQVVSPYSFFSPYLPFLLNEWA